MERRVMKKSIMICIILSFCFFAASCFYCLVPSPNNDWRYKLPNNYEIWRVNSREIVLGELESEYSLATVVDEYISEFCYNERYVCVKRVDVPEDLNEEIDTSNPEYYIVDTAEDIPYGPYDINEFYDKKEELQITGLSSWIATKPRPEGATVP